MDKAEGQLADDAVMASAARDTADEVLDPVVLQIVARVVAMAQGNTSDPHVLSYTGGQTPYEITKPVLGPELVTAQEWLEPLAKETDQVLLSLVAPLQAAVSAGLDAEKEIKRVSKAITDCRLIGERKKAVDALNAARGALHGKLIEFQHSNPALHLPAGWAESFFRHSTKTAKMGRTVSQVKDYIAGLDQQRAAAQELLETLEKRTIDRQKAKEDRDKARKDLAAQRAANREGKAKEKALRAEAKKKIKV